MRREANVSSTPDLVAAARSLSAFDPLRALQLVALRSEPPALMLRGVALAQLGDFAVASKLLEQAAKAFAKNSIGRARALAALGEVALAQRDLERAGKAFATAHVALNACGDRTNALFVRLQLVRRLVLLGKVEQAASELVELERDLAKDSPRLRALAALTSVEIEVRSLRPEAARRALARANTAARKANVAALDAEIQRATRDLDATVARLVRDGAAEQPVTLDDVAKLLRSKNGNGLLIDACRREIRFADQVVVSLVKRPVLLGLAVILGKRSPSDATREELIEDGFDGARVNESSRVRLRVEIGRLRRALGGRAEISATDRGFVLVAKRVAVLLPPVAGEESAILALLRDGEAWSTSSIATAIGAGQRAVQRALAELKDQNRVEGIGKGRSQRWVARPPDAFAIHLLLLTPPATNYS